MRATARLPSDTFTHVYFAAIFTIAALALAGCATSPTPPPAIVVKTERVEVPIPTPCVDADQIPAMPPRVGDRLTGDAARDLDVVAASAIRLRAALGKALALLGACGR